MEWKPEERDAWVGDAQRWITGIPGVKQSKIELDENGEIAGVHVVAGMTRDPRHIVRDVESLLKVRAAIDVNYKKIGVVQVVDDARADDAAGNARHHAPAAHRVTFLPPRGDEAACPPESVAASPRPAVADRVPAEPVPAILVAEDAFPRLSCRGVSLMSSDRSVRAEVSVAAAGRDSLGVAESANHADSDLACLARATVDAVGGLLALPVVLHLREVRLDHLGGQATVLVAVDLVESRRTETLLGACAARHNRQQAVVHAVLAALNRRLGLFALRDAAAGD